MKKLPLFMIFFPVIAVFIHPHSLRAQFFKKMANSVKQAVQNKADNKAGQAAGQAVDSSLARKSGNAGSSQDTTGVSRVLGAFATAAAQNPNDTSSADVTMKALSILAAGRGISAADSAAAIKSFMTAQGGNGFFYQTTITINAKDKPSTQDTTFAYMAGNGEGRSEMRIPMPGIKTDRMVLLAHAGQPGYSVSLYAESKTYALNVIDTSLINHSHSNYQVTRVGEETVQGYSCVHSKMVSSVGSGAFRSSTTMDIWTSTQVPGYATYKKLSTLHNTSPGMIRALDQAGCGGFFVKMVTASKDYSMTMALISAKEKNMPASLFQIPSGYAESREGMIYHLASGARGSGDPGASGTNGSSKTKQK